MKLKYIFIISLLSSLFFSCKEKTAESSKFKSYILKMDSVMNIVSEEEAKLADSATLENIVKYSNEAKSKFSILKKLVSDSIMPSKEMIDNAGLIRDYRGSLIKGMSKNNGNKIMIDKELSKTKSQFKSLRENLVFETLPEDSVQKYFDIEMDYANQLVMVLEQYNLLNESALNFYKTNTPGIDSLINMYTPDSTVIDAE